MLEWEEKVWQAGEGFFTSRTEEAAGLALLFLDSGSFGLTWAGAMPVHFPATPGTYDQVICVWCTLWRLS